MHVLYFTYTVVSCLIYLLKSVLEFKIESLSKLLVFLERMGSVGNTGIRFLHGNNRPALRGSPFLWMGCGTVRYQPLGHAHVHPSSGVSVSCPFLVQSHSLILAVLYCILYNYILLGILYCVLCIFIFCITIYIRHLGNFFPPKY